MLYEHIAALAQGPWNLNGQLGLVVGATYPAEVARVRALAPTLPLLIPGVGAQGGDAQATVKAGWREVRAPVYSHLRYDVIEDAELVIERPDILIVEGLNVLQLSKLPKDGKPIPMVSDFFDFSVYLDADETDLRRWYVDRFMMLRKTAFQKPESFFHRLAGLDPNEARAMAQGLWDRINLPNLRENILPTRPRADLILRKGPAHRIEEVALRRL
jgi:type I pantothenate kinase